MHFVHVTENLGILVQNILVSESSGEIVEKNASDKFVHTVYVHGNKEAYRIN